MEADRTAACPNCGAPVVEGRCSSVTCQNHNGTSAASTTLEVKVTVDLPGPKFRGLRQHGVVYARLSDVMAFLDKTAQAFDDAHANADIGKSFRACRKAIEDADSIEVEG